MIGEAVGSRIDFDRAVFEGAPVTRRHLRDLAGCFADEEAFLLASAADNPLVYTVSTVTPAEGDGQLHYGLGMLRPGRVGAEYYLTKGHLHAWPEAAEVYVGLGGEGWMLLEAEETGEARLLPVRRDAVVYVPGHTAHRTINTGREPLLYLGIFPAGAGHDYGVIARRGFRHVLVERDGQPRLIERQVFAQ